MVGLVSLASPFASMKMAFPLMTSVVPLVKVKPSTVAKLLTLRKYKIVSEYKSSPKSPVKMVWLA